MFRNVGFGEPCVRRDLDIDIENPHLFAIELDVVGEGLRDELHRVVGHTIDLEVGDIAVLFGELRRLLHRLELHLHNGSAV